MTAKINNIGNIIKTTRKRASLSRHDLSQLADIGTTTIYDIEHGKKTIQLQSLIKLCHALNITISITPPPLPDVPE